MKKRIGVKSIVAMFLFFELLIHGTNLLCSHRIASVSRADEFICSIILDKEEVEAGCEITATYEYNNAYTLFSATWYNAAGYSTSQTTITINECKGTTTFIPTEKGTCYFTMIFQDASGTFLTFTSNVAKVTGVDVLLEPEKKHISAGITQTVKYSIVGDIEGADITGFWWIMLKDNQIFIDEVNPVKITEKTGSESYTPLDNVESFGFHIDGHDRNGIRICDYSNQCWKVCPPLVKHDRIEPTYTTEGREEFWDCNFCYKMFSDADGINQIYETVTIPALGYPASTTISGIQYKLNNTKNTAILVKPINKNIKTIKIPDAIKLGEKTYKITEIAANACKGLKKLTTLTIGKNITKIGKNAFYNCKKLKTITVKTSSLTKKTIGKSCFKGIAAKATFKVPKKMLANYQDWFISIGKAPKTAKFK